MSEWNDYAEVLRDFMSSWSRTIGTGSGHSIERIEEAICYFARDDGLKRLLEGITELEAENEALRKAGAMHYRKGHNDTCSHALIGTERCDCGLSLASEVLGDE